MTGFSRSEFIIVHGEPYFLEINTVPGLTAESILPQQAKKPILAYPNYLIMQYRCHFKNNLKYFRTRLK